jgi:lipopolysaccharide transport system ATP-binding protein
MSKVVLKAEDISKQYHLGQFGTGTLSHDINRWWYKVRHKEDPYLKIGEVNDRSKKGESNLVWALKNINFEIKEGEVLGIIGKNGAGKSTLLKILSRVTSPTTGNIGVKGRIASLLEVGTGFHPELSGRENIFLNGAILGMSKQEIKNKFDEIVDFSGVERYIDTPVKRYSSGMYVRLAFAVAAYLDPEILIVDEVLAVGDADFQKKCIDKMKSISHENGKTILIVSHNLSSISSLCSNCFLLEHGSITLKGEPSVVIKKYLDKDGGLNNLSQVDYSNGGKYIGNNKVQLLKVFIQDSNKQPRNEFDISEKIVIGVTYKLHDNFDPNNEFKPYVQFTISNSIGETAFAAMSPEKVLTNDSGTHTLFCVIPGNFCNVDTYFVTCGMAVMDKGMKVFFNEENILKFTLAENVSKTCYEYRNGYLGTIPGILRPLLIWEKII